MSKETDIESKSESESESESESKSNFETHKSIQDVFQMPISFNPNKQILNSHIIQDLELIKTIDNKESSIYKHIFSPNNCFGDIMLESFTKYYTTDIQFLKDTQVMLKNYKASQEEMDSYKFKEILDTWNEIKKETGFCEKYLYIDWEHGKFLNHNPIFLQIMSLYNIISPLLSLFLPIFVLIIPFFIIKMKGLDITMIEYVNILKIIIANHAIGKIFTEFNNIDTSQKIYLIVSAAFYVFSIYQNILVCIRFYSNTKKIHDYLFKFKNYIQFTISSMDSYLLLTNNLTSYASFQQDIIQHKNILKEFKEKLDSIKPFQMNISKLLDVGNILHTFYQLHDNKIYNNSLLYSFGFNGYINNIEGLCKNISNKHINYAKLLNKKSNKKSNKNKNNCSSFTKAFYPNLINTKHVKNTYKLDSNYIISGPNASGKTTLLKTTLINIILSQQIACGCYKKANIIPYDYLHCYLNIPDTSGRDSLFQAEARRCKEIIDMINNADRKQTHFCIFDELYSGTNPEEATISAIAFMEYLVKYQNIKCMLTTHYIKVCKHLSTNENINNYNMKTLNENNQLKYTYLLVDGISDIKGGFKVLSDMNYPTEIINKTNHYNSLS